jgi:ribosome-associated translation inhibitor RaiA
MYSGNSKIVKFVILKSNIMTVQVNTDKNIENSDRLETFINEKMNHALRHFDGKLTRLEVHLTDQNGEKSGADDIQCRIEARPKGLQPIIVTARNANLDLAINDGVEKMRAALTTTFGKLKK